MYGKNTTQVLATLTLMARLVFVSQLGALNSASECPLKAKQIALDFDIPMDPHLLIAVFFYQQVSHY